MQGSRIGMIYSLLTAICWSLTGIFIVFLTDLAPLTLVWARATIAALSLLLLMVFFRAKKPATATQRPSHFAPWHLVLAGTMSLYYLFSSYAFLKIPVAMVAMIIGCAPLLILLVRVLQGQPPSERSAKHQTLTGLNDQRFILTGKSNPGKFTLHATAQRHSLTIAPRAMGAH